MTSNFDVFYFCLLKQFERSLWLRSQHSTGTMNFSYSFRDAFAKSHKDFTLRIFISINLQFYLTPRSTHIAAAFDRHYDQAHNHAILLKLRQLLSVYQQMENDAHSRYPWPSPPAAKFTPEEFQKLRNCRYLRLTKSNIESLKQLQESIEKQNRCKGRKNDLKN